MARAHPAPHFRRAALVALITLTQVRRLREQLADAAARLESQARHIEALYALAGHTVALSAPGAGIGSSAAPHAALGDAASTLLGASDTIAHDLLSRERARALEKVSVRWVVDVGSKVTALAFMCARSLARLRAGARHELPCAPPFARAALAAAVVGCRVTLQQRRVRWLLPWVVLAVTVT